MGGVVGATVGGRLAVCEGVGSEVGLGVVVAIEADSPYIGGVLPMIISSLTAHPPSDAAKTTANHHSHHGAFIARSVLNHNAHSTR